MHLALLLAVALQLEPNPPAQGEAATLIITTHGETAPLRVDVGGAAMLRRVPEGANVERVESDLHLLWQRAPESARVDLVLRADKPANWLDVTAVSGTTRAKLGVTALRRDSAPPMPADRVFPLVGAGLAVSLLMWPTFRLFWRHSRLVGAIGAVAGTVISVILVRMWWAPYAAAPDYREGRCAITDRMLVYRGPERSTRFYSAMYAVELDGRPRIAGDSDSVRWTDRDDDAYVRLGRFEIGKTYPCWWSVRDRDELLLEPRPRVATGTVLATVIAFLVLILPGWMRPSVPRRQ